MPTSVETGAFDPVVILYRNWRGETAVRRIVPEYRGNGGTKLFFGSNEWHPTPQWLFFAVDADKGQPRCFAAAGIKAWGQEAVDAALTRSPAPAPVPESVRLLSEAASRLDRALLEQCSGPPSYGLTRARFSTEMCDAWEAVRTLLASAPPTGRVEIPSAGGGVVRGYRDDALYYDWQTAPAAPEPAAGGGGEASGSLIAAARRLDRALLESCGGEPADKLVQARHCGDLIDAWAALRATLSPARWNADGGWQPIETAPRDGREVDVFGGRYGKPTAIKADGDWWNSTTAKGLGAVPTHWRPRPAPPSATEGA